MKHRATATSASIALAFAFAAAPAITFGAECCAAAGNDWPYTTGNLGNPGIRR